MSIAATLIPELDQEFATTLRVLERVPEEKFDWKPHDSSTSLQGLAWHIAQIPGMIADTAGSSVFDFDPTAIPGSPATKAEILAEAQAGHGRLRDYLAGVDDATVMGSWTLRIEGEEKMTIPRIGLIRAIAMNHVYHHRGQLSVYLRMLDVPVPSIYGPSGDENPWT